MTATSADFSCSFEDGEPRQTFRWRRQTTAFGAQESAPWRHYRLRVTATNGDRLYLAQVELLADATGGDL